MTLKKALTLFIATTLTITSQAFTVVLDAGHGGHDAGAIGSFSKEKNINLRHVTLVGDMLKERNPEIKVIYTRDKDVFIELNERARIANRNNADLFVSIHTNSTKGNTAHGIETFSLGVSRSKENMEVAMLENSVILLEEDHEDKYQGFDPNSTDSYIMFEFMKDEYSQRSVSCADFIQKNLVSSSKRMDRGVRQAGFLVLRATAMPAVLVELGFISNREEERVLNDDNEQIANAEAIYNGIIAYIKSLEKKGGETILTSTPKPAVTTVTAVSETVKTAAVAPAPDTVKAVVASTVREDTVKAVVTTTVKDTVKAVVAVTTTVAEKEVVAEETAATPSIDQNKVIYKVQILVSSTKRNMNDQMFKGLKNLEEEPVNNLYKYLFGATNDYNEALKSQQMVEKRFTGAFIVAYKNGVKVNVQDTLK